jgi:hypothetical protein
MAFKLEFHELFLAMSFQRCTFEKRNGWEIYLEI